MEKCLIVAVADNGAIGVNGDLPWHISEDLKFFKRTTMGCPVIMGRTTFESLGRPLPGRLNLVLSRSERISEANNPVYVNSLESAFTTAEQSLNGNTSRCFIIGGAKIYAQSMELVDRMFITFVHTAIKNADAFFPSIDLSIWQEISRSELFTDEASGLGFEFVEYIKY